MYDNTNKKKDEDLIDDDVFNRAVNLVKTNGNSGSLGARKNAALNAYLNREDFKYDVNSDALYHQYKDKYIQQGQQAMQDTMGQAAALTGGYGSSYAQNVGQQAYNSHLQKLNDVVPELYQMAYNRYQDKGAELLQRYGLLSDEEERDYNRRYQEKRDAVSDQRYEQEFAYQKERDIKSDEQWQQNFNENQRQFNQNYDYQVSQDSESSTKEKAYALAAAGDYSGIEALYGMTPEQAKAFAVSQGLVTDDSQMTESKAYAMALTGDYSGIAQLYGLTPEEAGAFAVAEGWGPQAAQEPEAETYTYAYTDPDTGRRHYLTSDGKDVEFDKGINPNTGSSNDDLGENALGDAGYQPDNIKGDPVEDFGTYDGTKVYKANGVLYTWDDQKNQYVEYDGYVADNTEAIRDFKHTWYRRANGDKDWNILTMSKEKKDEYIEDEIERRLADGRLTSNEAAVLMAYYGVGKEV